jgi:energy-converting hydrogenase Eha subunit A
MWIIKNTLYELQVVLLVAALVLHLPWFTRRYQARSAASNVFPPVAGALGTLLLLVVTVGEFSESTDIALLLGVGVLGFAGFLILLAE